MALLADGELHDVDHIRDECVSILKPNRQIIRSGFLSQELHVVGIGALRVAEAVLVIFLYRESVI